MNFNVQTSNHVPPEISSEPLVPDVSFLPKSASLEQEHLNLTRDIIKGDKALAQVNKFHLLKIGILRIGAELVL